MQRTQGFLHKELGFYEGAVAGLVPVFLTDKTIVWSAIPPKLMLVMMTKDDPMNPIVTSTVASREYMSFSVKTVMVTLPGRL
jgi:hypothetical protein